MSNMMSDEQLDREWKPNGIRPQSTIARSFSLELGELFKMDSSIADLDAVVDKKKQEVSAQTSELEALEARLKATEERLKAAAANPKTTSGKSNDGASSPRQRVPVGDAFAQGRQEERSPTSPLATNFGNKTQSRPNSGWKQEPGHEMPGGLPPTPGASEGEYVIVARERTSADYVFVPKDGDSPIAAEAK